MRRNQGLACPERLRVHDWNGVEQRLIGSLARVEGRMYTAAEVSS
jgi:hypothetical protein